MKKKMILLATVFLGACAHTPNCGNPEGARIILMGEKTCQVRIRQVTLGTELKIPQSLKGAALANFSMEWVEPSLDSGRIELGHFVLSPSTRTKESSR